MRDRQEEDRHSFEDLAMKVLGEDLCDAILEIEVTEEEVSASVAPTLCRTRVKGSRTNAKRERFQLSAGGEDGFVWIHAALTPSEAWTALLLFLVTALAFVEHIGLDRVLEWLGLLSPG